MTETELQKTGENPGKSGRKNDRRSVVTGEPLAIDTPAIRFVLTPDGTLVADLAGKLPGRGAWLEADAKGLAIALKKGAFARSLRSSVTISDTEAGFIANLQAQLERACLSRLGLALRAGQLVTGFDKVREALKKGKAIGYVAACDGARDGRDKLLRLIRATQAGLPVIGAFSCEALSTACGQENVNHAAILHGPAGAGVLREVARLAGFVELVPFSTPDSDVLDENMTSPAEMLGKTGSQS